MQDKILKLPESIKNIIFVSEGGIGRVIASTAVVAQVKKIFPDKKIIVVSGCLEVWMNNPHVSRAFNFQNPLYFYDDYVIPESYIMHVEPYRHADYLHGEIHLVDAWCDLIGIPRPESRKPELYFLKKEVEAAKIFYDKTTKQGDKIKKKLAVLQWIGGIVPQDKSPEGLLDSLARMHKRSIPHAIAQQIANALIARDYEVVAIQAENFPEIQGAKPCKSHLRNILGLLYHADAFIGIDSFMQHAAAAIGKPGIVCWGGTNPRHLGYEIHRNLNKVKTQDLGCAMPNCNRPNSYVFDLNPSGFVWNCPHNEVCMEYDLEEIMDAFDELYAPKPQEVKEEKTEAVPAEV